jgi:hypothetical protein
MHITATDRTPAIDLTHSPLKLVMAGESFPEDVSAFYGEVITAINQLSASVKGKLEVEMAFVYINSSSIKAMYRIFEGIDAYRQAGNEVRVVWRAEEDDDIMQELGEDFKDRFQSLNFTVEQHG